MLFLDQLIELKMSREYNQQSLYIVEKILARKKKPNCPNEYLYKVKWKDWDLPQDLTWQPVQNLETVQQMLEQFNKKFKTVVQQVKKDSESSSSQSSKEEGQHSSSSSPNSNSRQKQSKKIPRKIKTESSKPKLKRHRRINEVKKIQQSSEEQEKKIKIIKVNYFIRKQKQILFDCDIQINGSRDVPSLLSIKDLQDAQNQMALTRFLQENLIQSQLSTEQIEINKKKVR